VPEDYGLSRYHCMTDTYFYDEAFTIFIAALNIPSCFAGHCDWQLPDLKELHGIVNCQRFALSVSAAFNDDTGSGCSTSCTASIDY